jgi:predicted LPLAT superfamily acyltransferase
MMLKLEPVRTSDLTNMEAGQLNRRTLDDLATINQTLMIDVPFNAYVQELTRQKGLYENALAQIRKSEETEKISMADKNRDKAVDAFGKALKLYGISDDAAEVEASRGLSIVFNSFKGLADLNYEAETMAIDKLVSDLESPARAAKVSVLNMGRYVTRLKTTNEAFTMLFGNRMVTEASTETYDMKVVRADLMKKYAEFTTYVLAMAKALETPLFLQALTQINASRKYYSDLLARRTNGKDDNDKPVE